MRKSTKIFTLMQPHIYLNLPKPKGIDIYVFVGNKNQEGIKLYASVVLLREQTLFPQVVIPNKVQVYGSQYEHFGAGLHWDPGRKYRQKVSLAAWHLKALDRPSLRCSSGPNTPDTTACIAKFIEKQLGCSMKILGGGSAAGLSPCNSTSQLRKLAYFTLKLSRAEANAIYRLTGCLAPCEKYDYQG